MTIRRVVPNVKSDAFEESREFYTGFLGFTIGMDMGWIMTFVSPQPWGVRRFFVVDPNGVVINIMSHRDRA